MNPPNLKCVALPVPEITGGTQKIWAVSGYAHAPFSPKFLIGFYSDWSCKCTRQIIIGCTQKIRAAPYAHAPFSPKFLMGIYLNWSYKRTRQI